MAKMYVPLGIVFIIASYCFAQHQMYAETYDAGEKLYKKGEYSDAYGLFSQVYIQSSDKDLRAKSIFMKALCAYKLKRYSSAAQEFDEFIRLFPDNPLIHRAALWSADAHFSNESYSNSAQNFALAMLSNDPKIQRKANESLELSLIHI